MTTAKKKPEQKPNTNLDLWNAVCVTDPAFTKTADTRGGFTSINATWQAWQATELWGPYGKEWGMRKLDYDVLGSLEKPFGVSLIAEFFCPQATFEIATDMPYKPNDDCFKKLLTDGHVWRPTRGLNSLVMLAPHGPLQLALRGRRQFRGDRFDGRQGVLQSLPDRHHHRPRVDPVAEHLALGRLGE